MKILTNKECAKIIRKMVSNSTIYYARGSSKSEWGFRIIQALNRAVAILEETPDTKRKCPFYLSPLLDPKHNKDITIGDDLAIGSDFSVEERVYKVPHDSLISPSHIRTHLGLTPVEEGD